MRCRRKLDCISVLPSSAVSKTGVKISAGLLCCFIRQLVLIIKTKPLVKLFFEKEKKSKKGIEKATVYLLPGMQEKSIGCNIIRIAMQM